MVSIAGHEMFHALQFSKELKANIRRKGTKELKIIL
jgi:hypothetical protein